MQQFQGLNAVNPNPLQQQIDKLNQQLASMKQQAPGPQQGSFSLPTLQILQQMHNLLEQYRNSNEKAYPDDLRQSAILEINKLSMFQDRMKTIPANVEQQMAQMFSNNVLPYLSKQQ